MAKTYVRDTSGLKRYQEALRKAKEVGGDYADYVKLFYKKSRRLRKGGVKIAQTGARVLSYEEFMINTASEGIKSYELVGEQFGTLTNKQAKQLQAALKNNGFDISIQRAAARQLSKTEWTSIRAEYEVLKAQGLTAEAAALEISGQYFGS